MMKTSRSRAREDMRIQCPSGETLGCNDFECRFDKKLCGTECMDEVVPCVMCKKRDECDRPVKEQLIYIHTVEETKRDLLMAHDALQKEILDIYKFWKSLKMRQKWTVRERLKDLTGQIKGLRYALHKLGVPFIPTYRTNLKIEETMVEFWLSQEGGESDSGTAENG